MVTIETMAKRYKMLPSEVLERATTYDLHLMDIAISYHNYEMAKINNNGVAPAPDLSEQEMLEIMNKVRP